uniref:Uncharacterized protein n=1 Tax=Chromera velia CCMP2878 TaxID=1169474 RepID=A0A0G4F8S5_9ALVE|eukprot:Cvel_15822.t1-p1 / transcript=Cvel_15822.t1 / gene=Cvel_15822 / organism=Chromera_velia_CCMP2878 / gene_product=hypothetical protein / transcript_product=hypothetical protein / location=Cvel_scaffold1189:3031-5153(+) / protein_length=503 / sequence_SO=supercontig / SO=protein_coding / is_pseudo=false
MWLFGYFAVVFCTIAVSTKVRAGIKAPQMEGLSMSPFEGAPSSFSNEDEETVGSQGGPKTVYFFRHGESVNNILSQSYNPFRWGYNKIKLSDLINGAEQKVGNKDTVLSYKGMEQALTNGRLISGPDGAEDHIGIFSPDLLPDDAAQVIYVSPLRRAMATSLLLFFKVAFTKNIPFKVHWSLSEQVKSISDIGQPAHQIKRHVQDILTMTLEGETQSFMAWAEAKKGGSQEAVDAYLKPLFDSIDELKLWNRGTKVQSENDCPQGGCQWWPETDKDRNTGKKKVKENLGDYCERVEKTTEFLAKAPEKVMIVVGHSNFIRTTLRKYMQKTKLVNAGSVKAILETSAPYDFTSFFKIPLVKSIDPSDGSQDENESEFDDENDNPSVFLSLPEIDAVLREVRDAEHYDDESTEAGSNGFLQMRDSEARELEAEMDEEKPLFGKKKDDDCLKAPAPVCDPEKCVIKPMPKSRCLNSYKDPGKKHPATKCPNDENDDRFSEIYNKFF